jgi:hypothetical protein
MRTELILLGTVAATALATTGCSMFAGSGGAAIDSCLKRSEVHEYLTTLQQKVVDTWAIPDRSVPDEKVSLRFAVQKNGNLSFAQVLNPSNPYLDESAFDALQAAAPFETLSGKTTCIEGKALRVTFAVPPSPPTG